MKRSYIIKTSEDIDKVFKKKQSVGDYCFAIYKIEHEYSHFKYSISIGKKYGNAVERNLAKRRIRDIINRFSEKLNSKMSFVIVVKPSVSQLSFEKMNLSIEKLLKKSELLKKED